MSEPISRVIQPGSFERQDHYYTKVLNAQVHPLIRYFFNLKNERIAERYAHLHPEVKPEAIRAALSHTPRHYRWGGTDLFAVTTEHGVRQIVVIETNSCPSGQKSMPPLAEDQDQAGYRMLLERSFMPMLKRRNLPQGGLAVLYDKNPMENTGYAATLADLANEPVHLIYAPDSTEDRAFRFTEDRVLEVRDPDGAWAPIRAAFRYVTQRPWNRLPPVTRTPLFNPVLICLAGGRNKMLAAKAYDLYNARIQQTGLTIRTPETIWDVNRAEVPLWVARMGGSAVIKVPYSNAGQGVFTVTSNEELDAFMDQDHPYDRFIVQALIGHTRWSSRGRQGQLNQLGTIPNRKGQIFVADMRFMVGASPDGFYPVAIYARRARSPLTAERPTGMQSWSMLGTNLSVKTDGGGWDTEHGRLTLMDSRDFNLLGVGLDDLIEAYIQTVLAMAAIDEMANQLVTQRNRFRQRFFRSINPDPALVSEIIT